MLNPQRSMSYAVASLRRLLSTLRASQSGKVQIPSILASRGFSHRASLAKPLLSSPIATARLLEAVSRGYATTTVKKPKRKTATKKTAVKKKTTAKKAAKKPKKKVAAKKPKKRVAKKPAKIPKPKILKPPTKYGISGYSLFLQQTLASSTGPGLSERFAGAAAQWRAFSDAEKETWKSRAQAESVARKQRYEKFVAGLTPAQIKEENSKRRVLAKKFASSTAKVNTRPIKDPNAPKQPVSAFLRFSAHQVIPGTPASQTAKAAAAKWKTMSDAEKRPYQQEYDADRARYKREIAAYR